MDTRKMHGFTLVELMVAITILATVSIVAYVSASGYMKRSYNSERVSAIASLKLSLSDSYQMKKVLPDPNSNALYFDERGTYAHSSSGAYGVSGYVSKDFMPARFVNFDATDPETHQFYGYGKLLDDSGFSLASVLYKDDGYVSYLRGTYNGGKLASLVRSYASSDFVSDGSSEALPYNPYDRKITARLSTWSGSIAVATSGGTALALTGELNTGDSVTVATGSLAVLHISDGSELTLGTASWATTLELSSLAYSDDNNLVSRVALFLRSGEVWTKAPKLRDQTDSTSEFSIQSDSALAAVRGTVFGMATYPKLPGVSHTDIMVLNGKVEAMKKVSVGFVDPSEASDTDLASFQGVSSFVLHSTGSFVSEQVGSVSHTYIQNTPGNVPVRFGVDLSITNGAVWSPSGTSTGTVDPVSLGAKLDFMPFTNGYRARMLSLTATGTTTQLAAHQRTFLFSFENPGADSYRLTFTPDNNPGHPDVLSGAINSDTFIATASGVVSYSSWMYQLELCKDRVTEVIASEGKPTTSVSEAVCTLPSVPQHIDGGYFAFEGLADGWDLLVSIGNKVKTKLCPDKEKLFAPFDCQDEHLVAYAPYDREGDLGMYVRKRGALPLWTDYLAAGYVRNTSWEPSRINGTSLTSDLLSAFPHSYAFSTGSSFATVWTGGVTTKGVYIEPSGTTGNKDSLKYDLPSLGIGNSFSIEMSVRGGALKRWFGTPQFVLFDIPGVNWGDWLKLKLLDTGTPAARYLILWKHINYYDNQQITADQLNTLDDTTFYRVIVKHDQFNSQIEIRGRDIDIWSSSITAPYPLNPGILNNLYVWSTNSNTLQWNDIIDSVKIYDTIRLDR